MSQISYLMASPREAHAALLELWRVIKEHAKRGARSVITWQTVSSTRRHALRKAFHGPVLRTIAEQVWLWDPQCGKQVRYHPLVWKRYFAEFFLDANFDERTDPETGELTLILRRRSTEELSDDEFAEFLTQVQAWAVTDLNVTFPEELDYGH